MLSRLWQRATIFIPILLTILTVRADSYDTCANLVNQPIQWVTDFPFPVTIATINACLCLSSIPSWEARDPATIGAILVIGEPAVTNSLTNMINENGQSCTYPVNATQVCSPNNPCDFSCTNGLTPFPSSNPTQCICEAPNQWCQGVCGEPSLCAPPPPPTCEQDPSVCPPPPPPTCEQDPSVCPPSSPPTCEQDPSLCSPPPPPTCEQDPTQPSCSTGSGPSGPAPSRGANRVSRETSIMRRANRECGKQGLQACGVFGAKGWECVDTERDLESCGGCMLPFGANLATGVDCTALPGVLDVACKAGSCVVERCVPGYEILNSDDSHCAPSTVHTIMDFLAYTLSR